MPADLLADTSSLDVWLLYWCLVVFFLFADTTPPVLRANRALRAPARCERARALRARFARMMWRCGVRKKKRKR